MHQPPERAKAELRTRLLTARRALSPEARERGDRARDGHLAALLDPPAPGRRPLVATYDSFGTEPDTHGLLRTGDLLPVVCPDGDLDWRAHPGLALAGLAAIADRDVVLVPALAVDRRGVRLGRGGGSYDRALPRTRGLLVALLHEDELFDELPSEPHDVRVHAVATPTGLIQL